MYIGGEAPRVRRNQMKKKLMALALCLVMLLSVFTCFTACSKEENDDVASDIYAQTDGAKTLTMWIVTENKKLSRDENGELCFSPEVQKAMDSVEAAFSKETKKNFKVNIDIVFLTQEEYYGKLETAIAVNTNVDELIDKAARALDFYLREMDKKIQSGEVPYKNKEELTTQFYVDYPEFWPYREGVAWDEEEIQGEAEEEYVLNEWGIPELKYPEAEENQVDIIYLSGQDRLIEYIENDWLVALDEDLAGVGALISDYVAPTLMGGVMYNGMTFAIPNNVAIGKYTYMLIDKQMYDEFGYGQSFSSDITLVDCKNFLTDVELNIQNKNSSCYDVAPINSTFDETLKHFAYFWNIGYEETEDALGNAKYEYPYSVDSGFSVLGALYGNPANVNRGQIVLGFNNLLADPTFCGILETLKQYDVKDYYRSDSEMIAGQKAAISYLEADYSVKAEAEENDGVYTDENGRQYYVSVVKYPEVGEQELFGNMFAVCSASKYPYACVEVLEALNTESTLRNILQYGVEGEHYNIDELNGELSRIALNQSEIDNAIKQGKEPPIPVYYDMDINKTGNCFVAHPEEGKPADYWEIYKKQNGEAVINPLLGFDFGKHLENAGDAVMSKSSLESILKANAYVEKVLKSVDDTDKVSVVVSGLSSIFGNVDSTIVIKEGENSFRIDMGKLTDPAYVDESGTGELPYAVYAAWVIENGYLPAA